MPNRILRDYSDSPSFVALPAEAERLFVRLMHKADDYGRFHADPRMIRCLCFPLEVSINQALIEEGLALLASRSIVYLYGVRGRPYLAITKWRQRTRATRSKFPPPDGKPTTWVPPEDEILLPLMHDDCQLTDDRQSTGSHQPTLPISDQPSRTDVAAIDPKRGADWRETFLANEERRTMPPPLASTLFRGCWVRWVGHLLERAGNVPGRRPSLASLDEHLSQLSAMGEKDAMEAIRHSISMGWAKPELPRPGGSSGPRGAQPMA